jgi:hypothetical protein
LIERHRAFQFVSVWPLGTSEGDANTTPDKSDLWTFGARIGNGTKEMASVVKLTKELPGETIRSGLYFELRYLM